MLKRFTLKTTLALSAFFALSLNCALSQTWTKVSTPFTYVHKIYCSPYNASNVVVSVTSEPINYFKDRLQFPLYPQLGLGSGIYFSKDSGKIFTPRVLENYHVLDIIHLENSSNFIASALKNGLGMIVTSEDNGANWSDEFNRRCVGANVPYCIKQNPFDKTQFFTANINTSEGITKTIDTFYNCQKSINQSLSSRSLSFSKVQKNLIFAASDKEAGRGVYRSLDSGANWENYEDGINNLRVICVYASSLNPAMVYCSADSLMFDSLSNSYSVGKGIFLSLDTGKTWRPIGANNSRITEIIEHPFNNKFLVAAADSDGVFVSGNGGYIWEQQNSGFPSKSAVHTVAIPAYDYTAEGAIIYAGTDDGLYISQRILKVEDNTNNIDFGVKSIYPNPSIDGSLNLEIISDNAQRINIEIVNSLGIVCYHQYFDLNSNDFQKISISNLNNLSNGAYFLRIHGSKGVVSEKITILN